MRKMLGLTNQSRIRVCHGYRAALRKVRERYRKPKGRGAGVPQPFLFG